MKNFIVHDATGRILRTGVCSDADISLQGEHVIEGTASDATQYIKNGRVVDMPPPPSEHHKFDYDVEQWVDPRTEQTEWEVVRARRSLLLLQSDWTQLPDVPVPTKTAWQTYRQALRDLTLQPDPFNVVWPVPPA